LHNYPVTHHLSTKKEEPVNNFKTELINLVCEQAHGCP
jgi:hypothetical protein